MTPESNRRRTDSSSDARLLMLSKELKVTTTQFLMKIEELEKLLPLIDE